MKNLDINVIAAVIKRNNKLLLCQRPDNKRYGGLWEFPGGKLEPGETMLDAASRELCEELGVDVESIGEEYFVIHDPGSNFVINFYHVEIIGEPSPLEHSNIAWVSKDDLEGYSFAINDEKFVEHYLNS